MNAADCPLDVVRNTLYHNTNHALTQVAPAEPGATLVIAAGSNGRLIGRPPVSPCSEAGRSEVAMGEAMAVSYTHLDVYKRQLLYSAAMHIFALF